MDGAADVVRAVMDDVRRRDWVAWAICLPDQRVDVDPARVVPADAGCAVVAADLIAVVARLNE